MTTVVQGKRTMSPTIVMVIIVLIAALLTYLVPSGEFKREKVEQQDGKKVTLVVPDSYKTTQKEYSFSDVLVGTPSKEVVKPVSVIQTLHAVPKGIIEQADLIFMVMFIGGMFGVLSKSGAIEAGLERSLSITKGNVYLLVPSLMIIFSLGSTFMGMAKEYLLVIPMVIAMTDRLGLSKVTGLAIVTLAVKVGYLASLTNPYALAVAQPLVGVPVFSGMSMRLVTYVAMMGICIAYVLWHIRRENAGGQKLSHSFDSTPLSAQHLWLLIALGVGVAFMVYASQTWKWKATELSAYYLFLSVVFAAIAKMNPSDAADAFVAGMKKVLIAAVLIGLATAVAIILKEGQIMDTIIHYLVGFIGGNGAYVSAYSMFVCQLLLDIAIPSTSGQAAVTMPILGPVGEIVGVTPQTTVFAFLMGNGLTNVITPTSSGLLIFLATAEVSWTRWAKYVWPLVVILFITALILLTIAVATGY